MKTMKLLYLALAIALAMATPGCSRVSPPPGSVAVLVDYPVLFGHGGVTGEVVTNGSTYVWPSTSALEVNIQPFKKDANFDDINSSDNVPLDFHAQANLRVTDPVRLIRDFGENWYLNNLAKPFESAVRRAVNKRTEPAITTGEPKDASGTTALDAIDTEVTLALKAEIEKLRLPVDLTDLTLGKANPPKELLDQRVQTAAQRQRVDTERQRLGAETQRKAAEEARAAADNAYRNAIGLSPSQFVQLESIKAWHDACARSGRCIVGSLNGATLATEVGR